MRYIIPSLLLSACAQPKALDIQVTPLELMTAAKNIDASICPKSEFTQEQIPECLEGVTTRRSSLENYIDFIVNEDDKLPYQSYGMSNSLPLTVSVHVKQSPSTGYATALIQMSAGDHSSTFSQTELEYNPKLLADRLVFMATNYDTHGELPFPDAYVRNSFALSGTDFFTEVEVSNDIDMDDHGEPSVWINGAEYYDQNDIWETRSKLNSSNEQILELARKLTEITASDTIEGSFNTNLYFDGESWYGIDD